MMNVPVGMDEALVALAPDGAARNALADNVSELRRGGDPVAGATPVPLRLNVGSDCPVDENTVSVAFATPLAVGTNVYAIAQVAPAASVAPWQSSEVFWNARAPGPVSASREIDMVAGPSLVSTTLCGAPLVPTVCWGNVSVELETSDGALSIARDCAAPALSPPASPVSSSTPPAITSLMRKRLAGSSDSRAQRATVRPARGALCR